MCSKLSNSASPSRLPPQHYADALSGRTVVLLFQKTSTRTRCAGEIGTAQLGGPRPLLELAGHQFLG